MDTTAEVPEFKIARVGKDRKRRGAGVPWFGGGGNGGGLFAGATGGAGSGAAAGMAGLLGKVGVLALIGTLSAGAWQVGKALRPDETAGGAKPKLFADASHKYSDEDLANVMRSNNGAMPNSLGYVSGSLDGMTPEERARKEAEAAEAARQAEEEAKKAEEEAAKQPADVAGSPAGMDPNALLKGVAGAENKDAKSGPFSKKFGALSSSFGGLAGGSGMAGGVGRGFSNADLANKGSGGKMAAMRSASKASVAKAAKARPGNSNTKGFAKRQLMNANSLSRQAASATRPESSAQAASQAFDNNGGAGNVITGPGVGTGSGSGVGDSGGSVNPNTGSPVNPSSDPYQQPATPKSKNVTKWQGLINAALVLLGIIAIMAVFAMIFHGKGWFEGIAQIFKGIMVALAAMVTLLGVAIMGMGQYLQGGILTAVGGYITYVTYTNPSMAAPGVAVTPIAAKVLVATAVGLLAGSFGKGGPAAAS